ncbi:sugar diacid recognition domain-containing protein [Niallia sp. NCCP-28]|uniref:CdaR family transcriptional regulator n=1 Tax=Niallia sp. NCCP-28 TaxID=2934712 RepID=UPI00208BEB39|nr:sugar diacid recognition domain-containing protein [Niallia sp. NCCP-28]GKU80645.1 hypothetical protein NCCP28_00410 [Niallia sp. NCCP-28]
MNITRETANLVVKETRKHIERNINVFNLKGIIISSSDKKRINAFDPGALEAIQAKKPVAVTRKEISKWKGAELGLNLPIKMQEQVIGAVGISGTPSKVEQFGSLVVGLAELIIKQNSLLKNMQWKHRTAECLLEELVSPKKNIEFAKVKQKLSLLGYQAEPPYYPIVFSVKNKVHHDLLNFSCIYEKAEAFLHHHSCIYGFIDVETFIIIIFSQSVMKKAEIYSQVETFLATQYNHVQSSYGNELDNLEEMPEALNDARSALEFAADQRVKIKDVEIQLVLNSINKQKREKIKKRIQQHLCDELKETLRVFFLNNLNIQSTSEDLFIHRNTLLYRLKKIESITTYNPRKFNDALILQLSEWL